MEFGRFHLFIVSQSGFVVFFELVCVYESAVSCPYKTVSVRQLETISSGSLAIGSIGKIAGCQMLCVHVCVHVCVRRCEPVLLFCLSGHEAGTVVTEFRAQLSVALQLLMRSLVTTFCFINYRILKPKMKHRRKKKLMNRKQMPQHFTEVGLLWIKTLLIRGSTNPLESSVCL